MEADHNKTGVNIAAIKLTDFKQKGDGPLPALPGLEKHDLEDLIDEVPVTISGYPDVHIQNGSQEPIKHLMYSKDGKVVKREGNTVGLNFLTSKGQNGGALTLKENGSVIGIYTGISKDQETSLAYVTTLTEGVYDWINGLD